MQGSSEQFRPPCGTSCIGLLTRPVQKSAAHRSACPANWCSRLLKMTAAPWISSPEMAMRDPGQGGRHRQTWRWSTPARIVGCGDASSRSVATAGDLVPSSAMAMLQLDVRGLVVSASSDAAMLERGEKKPPRGVRGGKSACGSGRKKPRRRSGRKTARPDVQLGHFSRIFRLIRCERPAVGAARSAVAFSRRASAPGAAARRAAPG